MTILPHGQPDDPGPDYGPLTFRDAIGGRCLIFMGDRQIGEITQASWLRTTIHRVTIHLGSSPRRATASTLTQAKTFAMQEVAEFFAGTPMRMEARR